MKKHKMPDMKEGGVNVTPLIDIVMCLIIFFMLVAKIGVTSGADKKVIPPETLLGSKIKDMGNTITLNVRDPMQAWKDSGGTEGGGAPPTSEEQKYPYVAARVEGKERVLKIRPKDNELTRTLSALVQNNNKMRVIIFADFDLKYYHMEQVLISCALSKVKDFNFQTKPGNDTPTRKE